MTYYAIIYALTIAAIIASVGYMQFIVSGMRHNLYYVFARVLIHGDSNALKWLKNHSYYIWCILFQWASIGTVLTMIGQFMKDSIFIRPDFIFYCGLVLWGSILGLLISVYKKSLNHETIRNNHPHT